MLLVDTSLWVVFRRPPHLDLPAVAPIEEIVTCLPVIQEVLQGFRDEPAFRTAREAMLAFPVVESPLRLDLLLDAAGSTGRRAAPASPSDPVSTASSRPAPSGTI